jgi:hypothetical protein
VHACVVALLAAGLWSAGCQRVGTAVVDVLQAQQTGIKLCISTPPAEDYVGQSRLIVHGRVTELHPVWPAESVSDNGYVGIWVEPEAVLKGSSRGGRYRAIRGDRRAGVGFLVRKVRLSGDLQ